MSKAGSSKGIVSKPLGSPYRSGRSRHWVKSKNPKHPAVKREAEEELRKFPPSGFENQKMLEGLAEDLEAKRNY
jgi:ATP-dependent DNA ligase